MNNEFNSEFCNVIYNEHDGAVILTWKKFCRLDDYRRPTMFAADILISNPGSSFIVDARNGFEDDKADVEWGFKTLLPYMSRSDCRACIFILNEINTLEDEMDLWTAEFKKYFIVKKVLSYAEALIEAKKISTEIILTDGTNADFNELCSELDKTLDQKIGVEKQEALYNKYNSLEDIKNAAVIKINGIPAACGGFKKYDGSTAEIKRVFVKAEYRGRGLATLIMKSLEETAKDCGYGRLILETGLPLTDARRLYAALGYKTIPNYGQYINRAGSVCMEKKI